MIVFGKDTVLAFDIDKTLIFWKPEGKEAHEFDTKLDYYGEQVSVTFHLEHVQLLKSTLARGRGALVWSGNGEQWAKNVINALIDAGHLEDSNGILIVSKPVGYVDDMDCSTWMGNRIYIKPHSNPYSEER